MNSLALIAIGTLIGLLAALLVAAISTLAYLSYRQRAQLTSATDSMLRMQDRTNILTDNLRRDVTLALQSMDANRLHDASVAIQHGSKQLNHAITALNKVIFAAGMGDAGMGLDNAGLDEMQDQPRQQVVEYDSYYRNSQPLGTPPVPRPEFQPHPNDDPFARWRSEQQAKADQSSGSSFPAAPAGPLPDLDAAHANDLSDEHVLTNADVQMSGARVPGMDFDE